MTAHDGLSVRFARRGLGWAVELCEYGTAFYVRGAFTQPGALRMGRRMLARERKHRDDAALLARAVEES